MSSTTIFGYGFDRYHCCRPRPSIVSINSGLQSPAPQKVKEESEPPELSLDAPTTPRAKHTFLSNVVSMDTSADVAADDTLKQDGDVISGPSSTASTLRPRMPRLQIQSYLGFSPLTSMWRGRQPTHPSTEASDREEESEVGHGLSGPAPIVPAAMTDTDISARSTSEGRIIDGEAIRPRPESDFSASSDTSVDTEGNTAETPSTPPTSTFSESGSSAIDEQEENEDDEDEDDRRTLRGQSTPTTPTAERPESVFGSSMLNTFKARVQRRQSYSHVNSNANGELDKERKAKKGSAEKEASVEKRKKAASKSKSQEREEIKSVDGVVVKTQTQKQAAHVS